MEEAGKLAKHTVDQLTDDHESSLWLLSVDATPPTSKGGVQMLILLSKVNFSI